MANPTDFSKDTDQVVIEKGNIDALGLKLKGQFSINESFRYQKEMEWLKALRQFNGIYDPEVYKKLAEKRSRVYPKVTRSKCISVKSRLQEICFPDVGKAWSIEPTPDSALSPEGMKQAMLGLIEQKQAEFQEDVQKARAAGQPPPEPEAPTPDEVQFAMQEYAKQKCEKMSVEIDDQLGETKYELKTKQVLWSGLILGSGCLKGPMAEFRKLKKWVVTGGAYALSEKEQARPYLEFVRLWDLYPDMSVTEPDDMEGIFQRHVMTKHDVRALARRGDFNEKLILDYLAANPEGDCTFKWWEYMLLAISNEGGQLQKGRKYEVLEYWGYIDARDLAEVGVTVPDSMMGIELAANVWTLGPNVIKAVLTPVPGEESPYHWFYFEKDESSIFGRGLPLIMRDSQMTICAAARMMLDNGAVCAGPQIEVNTDLIDDAQNIDEVFPFKIWARQGRNMEAQYPAVRAITLDSHITEYLEIIKQFMDFADLETAFPTYMLIEPQKVGSETAQGASLRFGSTNITVKDIARNIDTFQASVITQMYAWNMEFTDDEGIKGDYSVQARGLSSLVAKEVRMNALTELNRNMTTDDTAWIKRDKMLQERFKVSDLPMDILRTKEEYERYMQETSDPRLLELQIQDLAAQIEKMRATSLANIARAKKTNVESMMLTTGGGDNAG